MWRPTPTHDCRPAAAAADDDDVFMYMDQTKFTLSQFVYFIITYYFLQHISAHLTHHQAELKTRKIYMKILVCVLTRMCS